MDRQSTNRDEPRRPASTSTPTAAGPGKQTLTEALPGASAAQRPASPTSDAATTTVVAAADAPPIAPAAALALGMQGEERPLPYRAALAPRFGAALDRVRCFFGPPAQLACAQVRAEAFCVKNVIVFGCDAPSQELVAHELAHVAQDEGHAPGGALASAPAALAMTSPGDAREQAADAHAHGGAPEPTLGSAAPVLSRYFATRQQTMLYTDRSNQSVVKAALPLGTRVARIYDPDDPGDGWVEVRVTHGGPLEATGFLQTAQLAEHADEAHVDWNKALQLYGELAGGSFDSVDGNRLPIPFGYSVRDCQARAQAMAQLLSEKGYQCRKVFAVAERNVAPEDNRGALVARTSLGEPTRWPYHVAPVICVRVDGRDLDMVIDPALPLGTPVAIATWMTAIGAPQFQMMELAQIKGVISVHDEKQALLPPDDKTLLPLRAPPIAFLAPSNVYDFMTLDPQNGQDAENRFLTEGAVGLERDHKALQAKRGLIQAIADGELEATLDTLSQMDRTERMRLLSIGGFQALVQQNFSGLGLEYVKQEFLAD